MKNKIIMILAAVLIMGTCGFTIVMPAFANSDIDSKGNMLLQDGDVAFYTADIEELNGEAAKLTADLPNASYATEQEMTLKNDLKSKGSINYDSGKVIFDSADLVKLADGIDNLNVGYKYEAVSALNTIGTYFKDDGTITYDENAGVVAPANASKLSFSNICTGILKSQSVEHLASQGILPASEDNLSEGSAAWVNGKLLKGNGSDNKAFYDQGYEDGHSKGFEEGEASVPRACCYFLGTSSDVSSDGDIVYNIGTRVPEVDYSKLTSENFIICPYKVNEKRERSIGYLSVSNNITSYCSISESEIPIVKSYDAGSGRLVVTKPAISAEGGISTVSNFKVSATTELEFYVYLIVGDIVNRT